MQKPYITFDPGFHELNHTFDYNEDETEALKRLRDEHRPLTLDDLRRVALWKIDRVLEIPDTVLEKLKELAVAQALQFDSEQSREALELLVSCPGVGFPVASAILKFLRPDVFPIIDVRAYRALFGKRLRYASYSTGVYFDYARRILEISKQLDVPLHEVDQQLYCFDRDINKGIGL